MDKEFLRQIDQVSELISDQRALDELADETLICECFCVSVGDIRNICRNEQRVDLALLKTTLGMGTGCGSCIKNKDYWIDRIFCSN